jgi:preprotein translocase subunit SecA
MAGRGADIVAEASVNARGGLHVILSERHEAVRIDRQLEGRTGRHGAPGSYEYILSLDDAILEMAPMGWPTHLARSVLDAGDGPWRQRLAGRVLRLAQRRAERLHARMRRQVLRADDDLEDMLAFSGRAE